MSRPTEFADTKEGKIVEDLELSGGVILFISIPFGIVISFLNAREKTTNIYSRSDDDYWGFLIPFIPFTVGIGLIVISKELEIKYNKDKEYTDNQRLADAGITFTVLGVLGGLFLLLGEIINKWLYAIPLLLIIIGIIGIVLIIVYKDDLPPR